jgi:lipoprotein-anchoring transpeptidase ErfK/SrfK
MKRSGGKIPWWCALATVAAVAWTASGQEPVTQVVPAASPEAMVSPAPAASGTAPMAGETAPVSTGTGPAVTGTASGTGTAAPSPAPPNPYSIEIDLGRQRVYLLKDGKKFADAPISSGRAGHLTPTGNFSVIQKDLNHVSNLYGKIVENDSGRVVKNGADVATPVPKGCKFVPAPMKWFMRFDGASGMHAGVLPGYPASHGCVRMPPAMAELFYNTVDLGTPVHVFGDPPLRAVHEEEAPRKQAAPTPKTVAKPTPTPKPAPAPSRWWRH